MIGLSQKLCISHREIETWDFEEIREHIAVLSVQAKKTDGALVQQTPEEVERGLIQAFGRK